MRKICAKKADPAADSTSNDAQTQNGGDDVNSTLSDALHHSRLNATGKTASKRHDRKVAARDVVGSKNGDAVVAFDDEDKTSVAISESNSAVAESLDKLTMSELLRTCARCLKQESTLHEFKKCKK